MLPVTNTNANANAYVVVGGQRVARNTIRMVIITAAFLTASAAVAVLMFWAIFSIETAVDGQRGVTDTWSSHDGRYLTDADITDENIDHLVRLVVRYHIDRLDRRGECNTPEECLAALEATDPRFYATAYMKEKLFPDVYQKYVGIIALLRLREKGIARKE
jgi:hypothetical protein